jgi:hypothetical protein
MEHGRSAQAPAQANHTAIATGDDEGCLALWHQRQPVAEEALADKA